MAWLMCEGQVDLSGRYCDELYDGRAALNDECRLLIRTSSNEASLLIGTH